ncbi:MAG: radical SAM protein [Spirochaetes bacterium]|nr:radical SAM protein [Spirochaetota bacterium]
MRTKQRLSLAFADPEGSVYDYPGRGAVFRSGRSLLAARPGDCIPLPEGSHLFSLPDRHPLCLDRRGGEYRAVSSSPGGDEIWAVAAFLPSGYLRTYLPAFRKKGDARTLTLWAYAGVAVRGGRFVVPGLRIDPDPRSDPSIHRDEAALEAAVVEMKRGYPKNRLVSQLVHCATQYRCLCARNFFLSRYEAPVPTTPACNASCLGCLSHQEVSSGFSPSQHRLEFLPEPEEIAQVMLHHIERVPQAVVSFGQGCEGEPLLRAPDLARAISMVRRKTDRGTIHLNTNGSLPEAAGLLMDAGLDSIRVSLNSPTESYYTSYYRPRNYAFRDVLATMERALEANIFLSLNLLFMPGFTDMETEAESLFGLLERVPASMIQTRNLNIDPDYYLDLIGFRESTPLGIEALLEELRRRAPATRLGYYNPPRESWNKEIS